MLHPKYLHEGAQIELPELSAHLPENSAKFEVKGVFAGGMGICLRLRQLETGLDFALKGVRPDIVGDTEAIERFLIELEVWLSASACELIAEAIGVTRINGTPCVLAPWMANGDLRHGLPGLNDRDKIEVLMRLVRGLSWVHEKLGVIHRDLKPENILLDKDGKSYVADWGLARPVGQTIRQISSSAGAFDKDNPELTQAGSFVGTVTYAAPEQILGTDRIDYRADIYSLGCMMFEFETGAPPFTGWTVQDIARQHIERAPPRLGRWFRRSPLGLSRVINKCLEKNPANRYSTYAELDQALVGIAERLSARLERCTLTFRYERSPLGKGSHSQNSSIEKASIKPRELDAILEFDQIAPFMEEATNLMALSRYTEAAELLRPYFMPELLGGSRSWEWIDSIAANYALCLVKIGHASIGEHVYRQLQEKEYKPSTFYVNLGLALLTEGKWAEAASLCRGGLHEYPKDADIQGNLTIALMNSGDLDGARNSAFSRLELRRDIHGIEESIGVLQRQASETRDRDLPTAISSAKFASDLIKEGLSINPRFPPLHLKRIQLRRFAHDERVVLELCEGIINEKEYPTAYRTLVFCELIEELAYGKSYEQALKLIQRRSNANLNRLIAARMWILFRHFMIGKENEQGQRIVIPEVREYFLPNDTGQNSPNPVIGAEILEWMGDATAAIKMLENRLSIVPEDWDAIRVFALIKTRAGDSDEALHYAKMLPRVSPWRTESYDWLSYVAEQVGESQLAKQSQQLGDEVFEREKILFSDLRTYLDGG